VKKGGDGGITITDTVLNTIGNLFLDAIKMKTIIIDELTAARIEIEKMIVDYVIDNPDDSDIRSLQKNTLQAKEKIGKRILALHDNIKFHILLAKASKNNLFVIIMESIMVVVADFLIQLAPDLNKSSQVVESHMKILTAIALKQRRKAITLLENHLIEVRRRLKTGSVSYFLKE